MTEVWKDIKGYEGLYQVSNLGQVKSLGNNKSRKEKILKPGVTKDYLFVTLSKDRKVKEYLIHRLVAEAFIPNPFKLPYVNHKDENKFNNCVGNLEWCTQQYNVEYSCAKPIYCLELDKVFPSTREACRITGVYHGNINSCLKGRLKSAGGYHWQYVEK